MKKGLVEEKTGTCRRCGRKLRNLLSVELGFGPVCYKKVMFQKYQQSLFEIRKEDINGK